MKALRNWRGACAAALASIIYAPSMSSTPLGALCERNEKPFATELYSFANGMNILLLQ
jgi:hypothetical protein